MSRIFVGLSGGVDSAVSAALLKQQGHDVVGAFIKIWNPDFLECSWKEDRIDAMRVCVALGVPFQEIDLSQEYQRLVVGDMIESYKAGITPNPDVLCNRHIKFGAFKEWALSEGADMIATGHYARVRGPSVTSTVSEGKSDLPLGSPDGDTCYSLLRAIDPAKDQSYFLYRLTQDDLAKTLLPIGHLHKPAVRALAKKFDLPVSQKPDSQGLCFVGDVSIPEFLSRYIALTKGPVVDRDGSIIGEHDGAALYTIGQRHGFRTKESAPHYVMRIDVARNTLVVSSEKADTRAHAATLRDVHWISEPSRSGETLDAQSRYHAPISRARLVEVGLPHDQAASACGSPASTRWAAEFAEPEQLSPGQSLVLYRGEECVGGGVVENVDAK